jgi:hypothetical protein
MNSQSKKVYFKVSDLTLSSGVKNNVKVDVQLNTSDRQSILQPFDSFTTNEVSDTSTDNLLTITFHYLANKAFFQINKYELKMSPKFLNKEVEKPIAIQFKVEKPLAAMIDTSATVVNVTANVVLVVVDSGSKKEKDFLAKNAGTTSGGAVPKRGSVRIAEQSLPKPTQKIEEVSEERNNSFAEEEEHSVAEDIPMVKPDSKEGVKLKSECLRKSLKIDYDTFTYNTACRRCNYLEKLVQAQGKDVQVLTNQLECFIKGNFQGENINIPNNAEELLKSEPQFAKVFRDDVNLEYVPNEPGVSSPNKKNSTIPKDDAETTSKTPQTSKGKRSSSQTANIASSKQAPEKSQTLKESNLKVHQKLGEDTAMFLYDDDKHKRIQKYEQEIDNLKQQLFSVIQRCKALEYIRSENETLRVQIPKTESLRVELEKQLIESSYISRNKIEQNLKDIERLNSDKASLEERNDYLNSENLNVGGENLRMTNRVKEMEEVVKISKATQEIANNLSQAQTVLKEFNKVEKTRVERQEEMSRAIYDLNTKVAELRGENVKLANENNNLYNKYKEMENSLDKKIRELADMKRKLNDVEAQYLVLKNESLNTNDIARHRDDLIAKFNRIMEINYNLNEEVSKINKSFSEQIRVLNDKLQINDSEYKKIKSLFDNKSKDNQVLKSKNEELLNTIEKLNLQISDLNAKKLYAYTTDENNRILQETVKQIFDYNGKIVQEINEFCDYLIKSADKNMTAQHYIRVLMRNLATKEKEAKEYRKYVDLSKFQESQDIYFPSKSDQIDLKIGELINQYPLRNRMKSQFQRESRGNYRYGSKKVNVMLEGGKLICKKIYFNLIFSKIQ